MRKLFFRADAGIKIGWGHFIRALALADMLKDVFECTFFTQEPTLYQINEVEKVCKLISLPSDDSKLSIFLDYLCGDEIVFLDNYFFTSEYQKQIKEKGCKLICFGTNDRHYYADLLFNFAETNPCIFSVEPYTKIFCGVEWAILRKPFREKFADRVVNRNGIVICFGGTDQYFMTEKVVDYLKSYASNCEVHVILTTSFSSVRIKALQEKEVFIHVDLSAEQVAMLFDRVSLAILSSSTICLEALSRGVNVIAGYYVDNQMRLYNLLVGKNLVNGIGYWLDNDLKIRLKDTLNNMQNRHKASLDFYDIKERYINLFKKLC